MAILDEIQRDAVNAEADLGTLLRKCKVLAARLGSQPLEDWLLWESNGYPDDVRVPEYRVWPLQVKGHFVGFAGSGMKNVPIPLALIPEKARKHYESYECRQSVAAIEALLDDQKLKTVSVSTGDLALMLGEDVYEYHNCIQSWAEFSPAHFVELLNTVRNKVLDFALAVWKEAPQAGEAGGTGGVVQPSKISQIFHTTVYGGTANLSASGHDSYLTINVEPGSFASVERALKAREVPVQDINALHQALEVDPKPAGREGLGPTVSAWIAGMVQKAANGTWRIGIGAAGHLLADIIAKYYGL